MPQHPVRTGEKVASRFKGQKNLFNDMLRSTRQSRERQQLGSQRASKFHRDHDSVRILGKTDGFDVDPFQLAQIDSSGVNVDPTSTPSLDTFKANPGLRMEADAPSEFARWLVSQDYGKARTKWTPATASGVTAAKVYVYGATDNFADIVEPIADRTKEHLRSYRRGQGQILWRESISTYPDKVWALLRLSNYGESHFQATKAGDTVLASDFVPFLASGGAGNDTSGYTLVSHMNGDVIKVPTRGVYQVGFQVSAQRSDANPVILIVRLLDDTLTNVAGIPVIAASGDPFGTTDNHRFPMAATGFLEVAAEDYHIGVQNNVSATLTTTHHLLWVRYIAPL